jgi:hypothetical protein
VCELEAFILPSGNAADHLLDGPLGFEMMVVGPADERDVCFIAEYPSVDSFVEMMRDPVYREAMAHRQAAIADSRLVRLQPMDNGSRFANPPHFG